MLCAYSSLPHITSCAPKSSCLHSYWAAPNLWHTKECFNRPRLARTIFLPRKWYTFPKKRGKVGGGGRRTQALVVLFFFSFLDSAPLLTPCYTTPTVKEVAKPAKQKPSPTKLHPFALVLQKDSFLLAQLRKATPSLLTENKAAHTMQRELGSLGASLSKGESFMEEALLIGSFFKE